MHPMEWSVGVKWSQMLEWKMIGTALLPGITEHNRIILLWFVLIVNARPLYGCL